MKVSGHCLCGQVVFEYTGSIGPANYCHCEDCRRHTGSTFNIGVRFDINKFRVNDDQPGSFIKQADSGNEITRHFCTNCGSPVHPEYVFVKAGLIDDPDAVKPAHHNWFPSAVPWCRIMDGLPRYKNGPGPETA